MVAHACHARRLWIGKAPGTRPIPSRRASTATSTARATSPTSADTGRKASSTSAAPPIEVVSRNAGTATASPASTAAIGSSEISIAMPAYATTQCGLCSGRLSLHGPRVRPTGSAGEPVQYSRLVTTPITADPGATSASRPTTAPGTSVLRVPTRAPAPTLIGPMWSTSPSSQ